MVETKTYICYLTRQKVDITKFQNQTSKTLEKGIFATPKEEQFNLFAVI